MNRNSQTPFYTNEISANDLNTTRISTDDLDTIRTTHPRFKTAVIMNYAVAALILFFGIGVMIFGGYSSSVSLFIVAFVDAGLTFWYQKSKSIIPVCLMLGLSILTILCMFPLAGSGFAVFMAEGLAFDLFFGLPAKIFAFIITLIDRR